MKSNAVQPVKSVEVGCASSLLDRNLDDTHMGSDTLDKNIHCIP
jgi:hypothetical protein